MATEREVGAALSEAMRRLRGVWPGHRWTDAEPEYRRVLRRIADPDEIERVVTAFIDGAQERYPPPPGVLVALAGPRPKEAPARAEPRWVGPEHNRCPECEEAGISSQVVIDANGIASCAEGGHRMTWRVG